VVPELGAGGVVEPPWVGEEGVDEAQRDLLAVGERAALVVADDVEEVRCAGRPPN
jgi:hypothetical protein